MVIVVITESKLKFEIFIYDLITKMTSSVIYKINKPLFRDKVASFDYDWTLVNPKEGKTFPKNINDWEWYHPSVPQKIKELYDNGFMIVIFTNQSKEWKHKQIRIVSRALKIPIFTVIASKPNYKPQTIMFDTLFENHEINKKDSFFVGDALGRKTDFSDSDKRFADNIGLKCYSPEEIFSEKEHIEIPHIELSSEKEIIIMVGFPGSGKSTISNSICEKDDNYIKIESDEYKTVPKIIKKAKECISLNKSIIFDATNSSKKKRAQYIELSKKNNYLVKCIHLTASLDVSYKRNMMRKDEKKVPKIAFSVYKKYYEEPDISEGFDSIIRI